MNMLGAENTVAGLLKGANMSLLSPCQFVPAEHWHCGGDGYVIKSHKVGAGGREVFVSDFTYVPRCRNMSACHLMNATTRRRPCAITGDDG